MPKNDTNDLNEESDIIDQKWPKISKNHVKWPETKKPKNQKPKNQKTKKPKNQKT